MTVKLQQTNTTEAAPAKASTERKTGDGSAPAPEEAYYGDKVGADVEELIQTAPRKRQREEEPEVDDVQNDDDEPVIEPIRKPAVKAALKSIKKQTEALQGDVEETGDGSEEEEEEASGAEGSQDDEDGTEEGEDELPPAVKKQLRRMERELNLAKAELTAAQELYGQAPVTPQQQQQAPTPPAVDPSKMIQGVKPAIGAAIKLPELSDEQFNSIMSDKGKLRQYQEETMALVLQQMMVNIDPIVTQRITVKAALDEFFNTPENKMFSRGVMRDYVLRQADQLEAQGSVGLFDTLKKAADLVRVKFNLDTARGGRVHVGREGLEVANQRPNGQGPAGKFATAGTRRRLPVAANTKDKKDVADDIAELRSLNR